MDAHFPCIPRNHGAYNYMHCRFILFFYSSKVVLYLTGLQLIPLLYKFLNASGEEVAHLTALFISHQATKWPNQDREIHYEHKGQPQGHLPVFLSHKHKDKGILNEASFTSLQ